LGKWDKKEEILVTLKLERASQAIEEFVLMGLERTMAAVNHLEF